MGNSHTLPSQHVREEDRQFKKKFAPAKNVDDIDTNKEPAHVVLNAMEKRTREAVVMIEAQAYIGEQLKLCRRTYGLQAPQKCANLAVEYLHMVQYNDIRAPMYPEGLYWDNKVDLKQDVASN